VHRGYHHGNLREVLIQQGVKLIEEKGVEGLTLREIGVRAGVSRTAAYRHFPDKTALLAAISEAAFTEFANCLERARDSVPGASEGNCVARLAAMGRAYLLFARDFPAYYDAMFGLRCDLGSHQPARGEAGDRAFEVLRNVIIEGQQSGELQAADAELIALAVWTMSHGIVSLGLSAGLQPEDQQGIQQGMTNLLLKGIEGHANRTDLLPQAAAQQQR